MIVNIALAKSKRKVMETLKADSVITLFHGSNSKATLDMCINGIDGRAVTHRLYPHGVKVNDEMREVNRGIFVTWDLKVARSFGNNVIKFKTVAKNIIHIFPGMDTIHNARSNINQFKDSFRPEVSYNFLMDREQQGLYIGVASPRSIECVYDYSLESSQYTKLSREEYIAKYKPTTDHTERFLDADSHKNATLETLVKSVLKEYGDAHTASSVIDTLIEELKYSKSFESQIYALNFYAPYSVAKKIVVEMRNKGLVPKLPSQGTKRILSVHKP
jgi:hypothetical protein